MANGISSDALSRKKFPNFDLVTSWHMVEAPHSERFNSFQIIFSSKLVFTYQFD